MIGNIVGLICCLMCAFPFFVLSVYGKNSNEPINFWSGDTTLKSKVRNIKEYNKEMAKLYKKYAIAFCLTGIGCLILPVIGIIMICLDCTLGLYLLYRSYKKILGGFE